MICDFDLNKKISDQLQHWNMYRLYIWYLLLLHCALSIAVQCIVIGPVCGRRADGWRAGGRCLLPR